MRILEVTPYFAPAYSYGGPPETVHRLCEALAGRGHEVTVLTTDAFSSIKRQTRRHTVGSLEVFYLPNLSNYLAWNHQLFLPSGTRAFLRSHAKTFDIIHVHSFRTYQNVVVRQHALRTNTPYLLSAHGSVPRIVRKKLAKTVFDSIVGQSVLQDAARLIAVSNAEERQYETMGVPSSKIAVIPNGIDAQQYSLLPPRGSFSGPHGLAGRKVVTYLGRLNSRKGLDTLLKSFRQLLDIRVDVSLVLAGPDDGYGRQVERMIKQLSLQEHVLLTGLVTLPEKLNVLVDSDVVVYPGSFEIFGLVPFEALLCRRPVIVADDSGCGEIIAATGGGITFPVSDSAELARAISRTLQDGEDIKQMTDRGRKFVIEHLAWGRIAEETEESYRVVLGS